MERLKGKNVLITGASSGIGQAVAVRFAKEGANIAINYYRGAEGAEQTRRDAAAARKSDGRELVLQADVSDEAQVKRMFDTFIAEFGSIDVLINNAGIAPPRDDEASQLAIANQMAKMEGRWADVRPSDATVGLSDAEWDRMIRVHLYGCFYGTRAALRHMTPARSGSIVNIASILGLRPAAGAPHYSAAKAGIIALTKSTAQEVAAFGVRVNAVCPGWVDTPLLAPFDEVTRMGIVMQTPIGRMARPDELAAVIRFLAGPESTYCVGDVFPVSGGWV